MIGFSPRFPMLLVLSCLAAAAMSILDSEACLAQVAYSPYSMIGPRQYLNRPTVSPYLNLAFYGANAQGINPAPTYQTIVRPQLEQREQAMMQQRQYDILQREVNQIRAAQFSPRNGQFATGNQSRFNSHSHYYPILDARR